MRFRNTAELRAALPMIWSAKSIEDAAAIRAAVAANPGKMRRLHDASYLTRLSFDLSGWLYEGTEGVRPIDFLKAGKDGIERLDAAMMDILVGSLPRAVFEVPGEVTDRETEATILTRLLWDRDGVGQDAGGSIHDPMRYDCRIVTDSAKRIAEAVADHLGRSDAPYSINLLAHAANDEDPRIREAAIGASGGLLGFDKAFAAVRAAREDPDDRVRLAAVKSLSSRAKVDEVAKELSAYIDGSQPRDIRFAALAGLAESGNPKAVALMVPACVDPDPEIAMYVASLVPDEMMVLWLRGIGGRCASGAQVARDELAAYAAAIDFLPEERAGAFMSRIEKLKERRGEALLDAKDMISALGMWQGEFPDELWSALAAFDLPFDGPAMQDELTGLSRKASGFASWSFFERALRSEDALGMGQRTLLSGRMGVLARDDASILAGLLSVCNDKGLAADCRIAALHAAGKAGAHPLIIEVLERIALAENDIQQVSLAALASLNGIVDEASRLELLRKASQSGSPKVRDWAVSRLGAERGIGAEGAEVLDLANERLRRKKLED